MEFVTANTRRHLYLCMDDVVAETNNKGLPTIVDLKDRLEFRSAIREPVAFLSGRTIAKRRCSIPDRLPPNGLRRSAESVESEASFPQMH